MDKRIMAVIFLFVIITISKIFMISKCHEKHCVGEKSPQLLDDQCVCLEGAK